MWDEEGKGGEGRKGIKGGMSGKGGGRKGIKVEREEYVWGGGDGEEEN